MSETSISSKDSDLRTPMPRNGQDSHYFQDVETADSPYGVTSFTSAVELDNPHSRRDTDATITAQHELVFRALSPQTREAPPSNSSEVGLFEKLSTTRSLTDFSVMTSESAISSRPGTPLSAPSALPIPSNTSSGQGELQSASPGPALVMPRIQVASKKIYTQEGKNIGKLRIAFCGDSCSGKTTLLRTIADHSPDIVHFEDTLGSEPGRTTTEINEVRASTQPYPLWKMRSPRLVQTPDAVMERNLCLVDTPGYALSAEANDAINPILRYVESQFEKVNDLLRDNAHLNEDDFLNLIASPQGGLSQVDCAVYCITKTLTETDIKFIHELTLFTTVIPVISKADLAAEDATALKESIKAQLQAIHFPFFDSCTSRDVTQPFLTSCIDPEIEASVMMQEDYKPTLTESELPLLMSCLFHGTNPARLRHYTAKKFLQWKRRLQQEQSLIKRPESEMNLLPSADFTIGRIAEHTRQEDEKTRLRIAAWATEMRTSFAMISAPTPSSAFLINEKSTEWILTRMNDYVEQEERRATGLRKASGRGFLKDEADPFGFLSLRERWSRRLKRTFKWLCDVSFTSCGLYLLYHVWERINSMDC